MKLHLLGVNGPFPESSGATSGYLLEIGDHLYQLDCGSGILGRLTSLVAPESLSALFISHWHFDHVADLSVLMYRLEACRLMLPVYGPADPSSFFCRMVCSSSCFRFMEVSPGQVFTVGASVVQVFSARHPVPSVGYRFAAEGRSLCYTGDTNTLPSLADDCRGCSLLLADGLFPRSLWTDSKPHLSAEHAAHLALESGAEKLIVTHLNPLFPRSVLLEEARRIFPGAQLAEAGTVIEV